MEQPEAIQNPKNKRFTSLLSNETLARVERMRLSPLRRLTNRSRGEHLSGKGGTSTDLADYRNYVHGDDVRHVDWNIFSRLNRPYIKQYQHEEEMHVVILLDGSSSMQFDGKFDLARQIAASLGIMGLMNIEKVSIYSCHQSDQALALFPPSAGRTKLNRLLNFLETVKVGGDFPIDQAVESVLRRHRGRGMAIIISDFLTFGDMQRPLNLLFSAGLEVSGVQILSPAELDPDITSDTRFVDAETEQTLDVSSISDLIGIYHEHREMLTANIQMLCRQRAGRFLMTSSDATIESVVFEQMRRLGWVS